MDDFSTKITNIVGNIRASEDKVKEAYEVKKLLHVVQSKFVQIVSMIEEFTDLERMIV